jgi:4-hydroxythreonine-4-phosphate dehydrogenase
MKPRIAFVAGDPSSIGPELAAKLLARPANLEVADVVVYADPAMLAAGERVAGARARSPTPVRARDAARMALGGEAAMTPGRRPAGGRAAFAALTAAVDAVRRGEVHGIVFAPLNKHALRLAGMTQEDELRWMQERLGVGGFTSEFNITGDLWTSRVTSHAAARRRRCDHRRGRGRRRSHRASLPRGVRHRVPARRGGGAQPACGGGARSAGRRST